MEQHRGRIRCAVGGGVSLGVGTLLFALCSPSSVSCATNIVVLTHGTVTAQSCAAYSMVAHIGVGLIVLGAVLLTGAFLLAVRHRRLVGTDARGAGEAGAGTPSPRPTTPETVVVAPTPPGPDVGTAGPTGTPGAGRGREVRATAPEPPGPGYPEVERRRGDRRRPRRVGPIAPGEDTGPPPGSMLLPPGWYGNPENPGGPVQWWDGTKLTDRPR
jgi:hypothetical protein